MASATLGVVARRQTRLAAVAARRALVDMYGNESLTHAASIAYYALLSLFPFLLLIFSVLGSVTADQQARDAVVGYVFHYFPQQFDFIVRQLDAFRAQTVPTGIGGSLALGWAALGVFNAISSAINHAWNVEHRRNFLQHRLVSFVMMLSAGAIFVVAVLLINAEHISSTRWFFDLVQRSPWLSWAHSILIRYMATILLIGCVALVYYFIPNTDVRFRDVWPGAIFTGLLWEGALKAFAWYARDLARWNLIHGSIAAVVVFMIWIYVCAVILIFGAELTAAYARLQIPLRERRSADIVASAVR